MKRFILFPGTVRSSSDGQRHFIGAVQLARCYEVNRAECVTYTNSLGSEYDHSLIPLHPRDDGRYKEWLLERKVSDFEAYRQARGLHAYYTRIRRRKAVERMAKSIAWHERHWPDFKAAYERIKK